MDFKVIFRDTFLDDLEQVIRLSAKHDPVAARKLGERIIQSGERLAFFPERHPKVRQRAGIRRFIVGEHFKIFYRVLYPSRTVELLRCWDARRAFDPDIH
ncbi:MAG: type II toxin-antitoxin system RelE/ParE family toxin [Limisphaerales bacterium]